LGEDTPGVSNFFLKSSACFLYAVLHSFHLPCPFLINKNRAKSAIFPPDERRFVLIALHCMGIFQLFTIPSRFY
jgi:hypothetical protein